MKKTVLFGLLVIGLAFWFVGCDTDGDSDAPVIETFKGSADGKEFELKITDGKSFELKIGDIIITGTAVKNGDAWVLTIISGGTGTLSVEVSGTGITEIDGNATIPGEGTINGPITVTPVFSILGTWRNDNPDPVGSDGADFLIIVFKTGDAWTFRNENGVMDGALFYSFNGTVLTIWSDGGPEESVSATVDFSNGGNTLTITGMPAQTMPLNGTWVRQN